jgi:L-iditol 2-dehydrogenase
VGLSKIFGASKIFASDVIGYRLNAAKRFGANVAANPEKEDFASVVKAETDGRGADIVVVTAPSLEAYKTGLKACRKGGKLSVFAPVEVGKHLQVSPKDLFFSEIQIIPSYSTSHLETRTALELIRNGMIPVKDLITHRFKLSETAKAFRTTRESKDSLKVIVFN